MNPELHVEVHGDGPLVVLGHGFGGSARNFRRQAQALRERFRVLLFDARGHARSAAPDAAEAYQPEAFVADLVRLLDEQAVERAVVGGLSMGAGVAVRFALAHPQRVRALVLAAPPPGPNDETGTHDWALGFADAIEREGLEAAGARYAWGESSGLDAAAAKWVRQGFLEHPPHGLAHCARELLGRQPAVSEYAERLMSLQIPTWIAVGGNDRLSLRAARDLAAALPQAQLDVFENAGHVVNLSAPKPFTEKLVEFLEPFASP